jgi:hypothetical protein
MFKRGVYSKLARAIAAAEHCTHAPHSFGCDFMRLKDLAKYREEARRNRLNDPPPLAMARTEQPRVIVFESNASTLGKIDNTGFALLTDLPNLLLAPSRIFSVRKP